MIRSMLVLAGTAAWAASQEAAESTAAGSSTEQLAFDRALFDTTDEALSAIYAEVRLLINCMSLERYFPVCRFPKIRLNSPVPTQADTLGSRDYRSGADLPSPLGGGRLVPQGPAALAAAVLRRIAPWTRRSSGGGDCSSGSGDGSDDIDAMLQHDAAEVSTLPVTVCGEPASHVFYRSQMHHNVQLQEVHPMHLPQLCCTERACQPACTLQ
jgi:hypothetical protein